MARRKTTVKMPSDAEGAESEGGRELPASLPRLELDDRVVNDRTAKDLAERLRTARQNRKLTLEALSLVTKAVDPERRGISKNSLSRYEAGADPGARELRLLSQALRRPLSLLVYGDSEDPMQRHRPSWEELLEYEIHAALVAYKLVDDDNSPGRMADRYEALLTAARKLARD